jgi:hypothetical protein
VAVAWGEPVEKSRWDNEKLRVVGRQHNRFAMAPPIVPDADLGRAGHAIPPIDLQPVAVPGFDHARGARRDITLPEPVRVIGGPKDFGQPAALVEVSRQFANFG